MTAGVLSAPRTRFAGIVAWLLRRLQPVEGFAIDAAAALEILGEHDPDAAAWWRTHAARSIAPGRALIFHAEVCEIVAEPPTVSDASSPDDADPGGPFTSDVT